MTKEPQLRKRMSERDEAIVSQLWKASQVARRISSFSGLPYEELRDAATEYIVKIYDTWDKSKGANFSTWTNRCLQFHMLNYLRDNSRLVKIPRSYSDLYLKIRKYLIKNPRMSDADIAKEMGITAKKVQAVRTAFAMTFSEINEYSQVIEPEIESEASMSTLLASHSDLLYKIAGLDPNDEQFLNDYIVKKRSTSTLIRKNPHLRNAEDIKQYSQALIDHILCDAPLPSKEKLTTKRSSKRSGVK